MTKRHTSLFTSALFLAGFISRNDLADAKQAPWTCTQLEQSTDPFYRMFPASLGTAIEND